MISDPMMPNRPTRAGGGVQRADRWRSAVVLAVACIAMVGYPGRAADPSPTAGRKIDWSGLDGMLAAGDYAKAVTAVDEIVGTLKPKPRDSDFLARSVDLIRLLMRRGAAELRLGQLDAADATLKQATRLVKDADFRRFVSIETRQANPRSTVALVLLDINMVELLDLRMAVILERLRFRNLGIDVAGGAAEDPAISAADQVGRWLAELEPLEQSAVRARQDLTERFAGGGAAVAGSPYYQSLLGRFRPAIVQGLKSLELGRVEARASGPATDEAAASAARAGRERAADAITSFDEAATALDVAIRAAAPKGEAGMKPEARMETALLRAELLGCQGAALLEARQPARSRERFAEALEARREAATLRKVPRPEAHADLFLPLLMSAEALLDEAGQELATGDSSGSRADILEASKLLERADALPFPEDHPLRARLADLRARLATEVSTLSTAIPGMDAADAAARRVRRAIDRTPVSWADESP